MMKEKEKGGKKKKQEGRGGGGNALNKFRTSMIKFSEIHIVIMKLDIVAF